MRTLTNSFRPQSSSRHTTQKQHFEVVVRYPHHPLAGKRIRVIRCLQYADLPHFVIKGPDTCRALLPAWMTDIYAAELPLMKVPRLSIDVLRTFRCLIDAQCSSSSTVPILSDGGGDDEAMASTAATRATDNGAKPKSAKAATSRGSRRDRESARPRVPGLRGMRIAALMAAPDFALGTGSICWPVPRQEETLRY